MRIQFDKLLFPQSDKHWAKKYAFVFAFFVIGLLFSLSFLVTEESEILFALIYVLIAVFIGIFLGRGPGIFAGILASLSVDYLYLKPIGSVLDSWKSFEFLIATLSTIQLVLMGVGLLQKSAQRIEDARLKLQKEVILKEEILRIVAHDLRQPIAAFSLRQELLLQTLKQGNVTKAAELCLEGKSSLDRVNHLIQDLLDGIKLEAGKLKFVFEDSDIVSLVESICQDYRRQADKAGKSLKINLPMEKVPLITMDSFRIGRVLSNLLSNALKFTPMGGMIELTLAYDGQKGIEVSVDDSGAGVKQESIPQLFQKNWQEASTSHLGTGLGLFISYEIISEHGGKIWYEASSLGGARFKFTVPG